jgi:formate dehydrogenase iron-sulfur subunit
MKPKGLLFDVNRCQGCGACYDACKKEFNNPVTSADFLKDRLSADSYTVVEEYGDIYMRRLCMHCEYPTCVSVCPVSAFEKTPEGPVVYDADACMGCRYCMQACPHMIPRYEWDSLAPRVQKCVMCHHRVVRGEETACAEACPSGATLFGDLEDLKKEAKRRLEAEPDRYYQHIYGLEEAGGCNVLLLSPIPFHQFAYDTALPKEPLETFTMAALEKVPGIVAFSSVFLGGMYWLTKRKNKIAREESEQNKAENDDR